MGTKTLVHLDTNALIYLDTGKHHRLSREARDMVENADLLISAFVMVELQFLHERSKIGETPEEIFSRLEASIGLNMQHSHTPAVIRRAMDLNWTRDLFDRLIVSDSMTSNARLITTDRKILSNYDHAIC